MLLICGYRLIRTGNVTWHRRVMVSAFAVSMLFLLSYLYYHYQVGSVRYGDRGFWRTIYLAILATHIVLAAAVPPLALVTLFRAGRGQFERHRRLARPTLAIWLYVSVTGVVIYGMLYGF